MEQIVYKEAIEQVFPYVSGIGDHVEIFKSYPIRVRTQEKKVYYEVGASNISENGEITVNKNEKVKERANATAFEKLYLRTGDIILPYRSKKLHPGLYIESKLPLVPNPSLIVIRSKSLDLGKYLLACLEQPFIKRYIETNLIHAKGKYHILDIEELRTLVIPFAIEKVNEKREYIEKYQFYTKRVVLIQKQLERLTKQLWAETIAGEPQRLESPYSSRIEDYLEKLEEVVSLMESSTINSSAINLLGGRI